MKLKVALVQAGWHQIGDRDYRLGLQAMWDARWRLRGLEGKACWLECHGGSPPFVCPLLESSAVRRGGLIRVATRWIPLPVLPAADPPPPSGQPQRARYRLPSVAFRRTGT